MTLQQPPDVASLEGARARLRGEIRSVKRNVKVASGIEQLRHDLTVTSLRRLVSEKLQIKYAHMSAIPIKQRVLSVFYKKRVFTVFVLCTRQFRSSSSSG